MTRFDSFCLRMIPLCLIGAAVVGGLQYRTDLRDLSRSTHQAIPGCASGKYHCSVRFEQGKPIITMAQEANHENLHR
jgi:hypothetical protein